MNEWLRMDAKCGYLMSLWLSNLELVYKRFRMNPSYMDRKKKKEKKNRLHKKPK